jgi:hypothetical protein
MYYVSAFVTLFYLYFRSVERQNTESVQQFLEQFTHHVTRMKESSHSHSEEQAQQLTEISKQLGK